MRATGVRPHARERDLLIGALLQQQFPVRRSEEEDREGSVKETFFDIGHKVAWGECCSSTLEQSSDSSK